MKLFEMYNQVTEAKFKSKVRKKHLQTNIPALVPGIWVDKQRDGQKKQDAATALRDDIEAGTELKHGFDFLLNRNPKTGNIVVSVDRDNVTPELMSILDQYKMVKEDGATEGQITHEDIADAWMQEFPNSSVGVAKAFGGGYTFKFRLAKDKSEVSSQIMDNDPLSYTALLDENGNWKEWRTSMFVAPPEGSHLVYEAVKFRKKSAKNVTLAQIQKRFKQVKEFVAQNADRLHRIHFDIDEKLGGTVTEAGFKSARPTSLQSELIVYPNTTFDRGQATRLPAGTPVDFAPGGNLERNNIAKITADNKVWFTWSDEYYKALSGGNSINEVDIKKAVKKGAKWLKRGMQGWDGMTAHDQPHNSSEPYNMANRHAEMSTDQLKKLQINPIRKVDGHSPAGLQQKLIKRNLRKRGERDFGKYMEEADKVTKGIYVHDTQKECPKCKGWGELGDDGEEHTKCPKCDGEGFLENGKSIHESENPEDWSAAKQETMIRLRSSGGKVYDKATLVRDGETALLAQNGNVRFAIFPDGSYKRAKQFIDFQRDGWELEMNLGESDEGNDSGSKVIIAGYRAQQNAEAWHQLKVFAKHNNGELIMRQVGDSAAWAFPDVDKATMKKELTKWFGHLKDILIRDLPVIAEDIVTEDAIENKSKKMQKLQARLKAQGYDRIKDDNGTEYQFKWVKKGSPTYIVNYRFGNNGYPEYWKQAVGESITEAEHGEYLTLLGNPKKGDFVRGEPPTSEAPDWARYLGRLPDGAYYWLSNKTVVVNSSAPSYFPDGGNKRFTGYVGEPDRPRVRPIPERQVTEGDINSKQQDTVQRLKRAGGRVYSDATLVKGNEVALLASNKPKGRMASGKGVKFAIFPDGSYKRAKEFIDFQRDGWELEIAVKDTKERGVQQHMAASMFGDIAAGGGDPIDHLMTEMGMSMKQIDALAKENGFANANEWAESYQTMESVISSFKKLEQR